MRAKMFGTMVAAFALTAGSVAAAQSAAPLSLANGRAGAELGEASGLGGGTAPWIVGAVALGLIVLAILEFNGDEEDFPTSP